MRADARANRQAIVQAARGLFAERGTSVSLRSIAAEADVGIATLYRNFPDHTALVVAVAYDMIAEANSLIDECERTWNADPAAAWDTFMRSLAHMHLGVLLPQLAVELHLPDLPQDLAQTRERAIERLEQLLTRAAAAGLVRPGTSGLASFIGLAAISRPMPDVAQHVLPPGFSDWLVDVYLRGLR